MPACWRQLRPKRWDGGAERRSSQTPKPCFGQLAGRSGMTRAALSKGLRLHGLTAQCLCPLPFRRGADLAAVLVVGHVLQPIDHLAIQTFLDGDVRHCRRRRSAVPMLLARRKPDHIARPDFSTGPPQRCTRPTPAVTISVCPSGWVCQAVRAAGRKSRWRQCPAPAPTPGRADRYGPCPWNSPPNPCRTAASRCV